MRERVLTAIANVAVVTAGVLLLIAVGVALAHSACTAFRFC